MSSEKIAHTNAHMFGEMVWLCSQSPLYKNLKIADLEWLLMPAMLLNQYRVFYNQATPLGFALWATVSLEVETRMKAGFAAGESVRLQPNEWNCGDILWLIELVCPTATPQNKLTQQLVDDLVKNVFKEKTFYFHQV